MSCLSLATRAAMLQPSRRELVTPSTGPVADLSRLKEHVSQTLDIDDVLLLMYEEIAHRWVEGYLGRSVLRQTWREWYDGPFRGPVVLLEEQAVALTSVTVYDEDDAATVVSSAIYQVDLISLPSRLILRSGQTWPTELRAANAIAVEYTAGWADADAVPPAVKAAVFLYAAHRYAHREVTVDGPVTTVPAGIESLLRPYRWRTGVA